MPQNLSTSQASQARKVPLSGQETKNAILDDVIEESRHVRTLERWIFWLRATLAVVVTSSGIYLLVLGRSEGALVALSGLVLQLVKIERLKRR
jgi:hypothetical protein